MASEALDRISEDLETLDSDAPDPIDVAIARSGQYFAILRKFADDLSVDEIINGGIEFMYGMPPRERLRMFHIAQRMDVLGTQALTRLARIWPNLSHETQRAYEHDLRYFIEQSSRYIRFAAAFREHEDSVLAVARDKIASDPDIQSKMRKSSEPDKKSGPYKSKEEFFRRFTQR